MHEPGTQTIMASLMPTGLRSGPAACSRPGPHPATAQLWRTSSPAIFVPTIPRWRWSSVASAFRDTEGDLKGNGQDARRAPEAWATPRGSWRRPGPNGSWRRCARPGVNVADIRPVMQVQNCLASRCGAAAPNGFADDQCDLLLDGLSQRLMSPPDGDAHWLLPPIRTPCSRKPLAPIASARPGESVARAKAGRRR